MWDNNLSYVFLKVFFYVKSAFENLTGLLLIVVAFDYSEKFFEFFQSFRLAPGRAPVIDPDTVDYLGGVDVVQAGGAVVAEWLIDHDSFNLTIEALFGTVSHEIRIVKGDFDRVKLYSGHALKISDTHRQVIGEFFFGQNFMTLLALQAERLID